MRIAFLTNEFATERNSRGLGSYLLRIARALRRLGHEPEVFVCRADIDAPSVLDLDGVRVERLAANWRALLRRVKRVERLILKSPWGGVTDYLANAWTLARALERRHTERPFDLVQSASCGACGLFVRHVRGRLHAVRISSHLGLWWETDGIGGPGAAAMIALERRAIRRANVAYAPSRWLAEYCRHSGWRADVRVLRPPVFLEAESAEGADADGRYLIHFGQIGTRKGSELIARALPLAWQAEPGLRMIWAGTEIRKGTVGEWQREWGDRAGNVTWLGMIPKERLYALVAQARAAVLPSQVDNLPNTVIESLLLGVPLIGSAGASIDELVEPDVTGELVPLGDAAALAGAMIRAWRGEGLWDGRPLGRPALLDGMDAETAAAELLRLVPGT